ncbi:MAG: hypothetical protein NC095_00995 [Muribaculum sp.]|nr:hypothetical protein [Muribaculum sp.]
MKPEFIKKIFLLMFCITTSIQLCTADSNSAQNNPKPVSENGILRTTHNKSDRKRSPSREQLEISYDGEAIFLESETVEGVFTLHFASIELENAKQSNQYPSIVHHL